MVMSISSSICSGKDVIRIDIRRTIMNKLYMPFVVELISVSLMIHKRHNDIVQVLIDHHRHGHFIMNSRTGFKPFMLAVHCNNTPMVEFLWQILPRQQSIDELALLACKYTIDSHEKKRDQAYTYFEMALTLMLLPGVRSDPGQLLLCVINTDLLSCTSIL